MADHSYYYVLFAEELLLVYNQLRAPYAPDNGENRSAAGRVRIKRAHHDDAPIQKQQMIYCAAGRRRVKVLPTST
jgi:hypothetical protein